MGNKKDELPDIKLKSDFISPWALPNEKIMLCIQWHMGEPIDYLEIEKPKELEFVEFLNERAKVELSEDLIKVSDITIDDYVGLIFKGPIFEETRRDFQLKVKFVKNDDVIIEKNYNTRIIRPRLEIVEKPEKIHIKKGGQHENITLKFKLTGYGSIAVRMNKEELRELRVTSNNAEIHELFKSVIESEEGEAVLSEFLDLDNFKKSLSDPETINKFKDVWLENLSIFENKDEDIDKLKKQFKKEIDSDFSIDDMWRGLLDNIFQYLEVKPVQALLTFLKSMPEEGIFLKDPNVSVIVEEGVKALRLRVDYKDPIENMYDPVIVEIPAEAEMNKLLEIDSRWEREEGRW